MDCILYVWLQMCLCKCCGNKFIRSNKNTEFTDCDAWEGKKEKWNNISSSSSSTEHSHRIKWLAQLLSHQQNRGCDMVLSFVTLKNIQHKMNANGKKYTRERERIWRLFCVPSSTFHTLYDIPFPFSIHNTHIYINKCVLGCSQYTSFVQMKRRLNREGESESETKKHYKRAVFFLGFN